MVKKLLNDLRETVKEIHALNEEIGILTDCYKRHPTYYEEHYMRCKRRLNVLLLARDGMHKKLLEIIDNTDDLSFPEYMIIIDYYLYANTDTEILNRYNMSERTFYARKKRAIQKLEKHK